MLNTNLLIDSLNIDYDIFNCLKNKYIILINFLSNVSK